MSESETSIRSSIQRGGLFSQFALHALANTGNNRVYRMEAANGTYLVKHYFQHAGDPRDRFAAECAFYSFVWKAGIRRTPEPLQWLPEERLAVFEFVPGQKPVAPTRAQVLEALAFFRELNESRRTAAVPEASEACFSLREHVECIDRRVARLQGINPETGIDRMALDFVTGKISPAWKRVGEAIMSRTSQDEFESKLPSNARCISPSDFGFHNSILAADGRLRFFDFEYAGWDDPAKTICDFFCQPAAPVDHSQLEGIVAEVLGMFPDSGLEKRVELLMPAYQIKWSCIMLNEFLPVGGTRRTFSNPQEDIIARKQKQLEKASSALRDR